MNRLFINENRLGAVCVFIFIQLTTYICGAIKCPEIVPTGCYCEDDPFFSLNCLKYGQQISVEHDGSDSFINMKIECKNHSDVDSIDFVKNYQHFGAEKIIVDSCPIFDYFFNENPIFSNVSQVQSFSLDTTKITSLPSKLLNGFENLEAFQLSSNELKTLPANMFNHLTKLRGLNLKDNKNLTVLPENIFKDLNSLQVLDFDDSKLTALPNRFIMGSNSLQFLSIRRNKLMTLSANVFENLTELTILQLADNKQLTLHPNIFHNLRKLNFLKINRCNLVTLPENIFDNLIKLENLFLGDNKLTTLPKNIFKKQINSTLKLLDMSGNSWLCDHHFLDIFNASRSIQFNTVECADGEPAEEKLKHSMA